MSEGESTSNRRIVWAATQVVVLFILSRLLGLVREMVVGAAFGTTAEYSAYLAAVRVPDLIFTLIAGGALGSAFIPTFAAYFAQQDEAGGWRLASGVINLLLVVLTSAAILAWLVAPLIVRTVLAPGWDAEQQALTVSLMRMMLVAPVIFGVSGVVMGVLNARQHFLLPALAPSFLNLALIGAVKFLAPQMGVQALAVGYVAGAVLHLGVQLPGLLLVGARYRPVLSLRDAGVRQVLRLMAPRVLGLAAVQINFLVTTNLASWLSEGAVATLNFAWLVMLLPQGVFAQAVATATFPTFADQVARGERAAMRKTLASTLRIIFFLTIPAAAGLILLGQPLVAFLFERGAFESGSTEAVAWALAFYALGLVGHAGVEIVARAFYALHDTWTPVWVGLVAMVLNVALSLLLLWGFRWMGLPPYGGLALANSIAVLLEMVWMLALFSRRVGGLEGRLLAVSAARSGLATAVMAAALVVWRVFTAGAAPAWVGGGGVALGAVLYLGIAALIWGEELRVMLRVVLRRRL